MVNRYSHSRESWIYATKTLEKALKINPHGDSEPVDVHLVGAV